jgi:cytochrome P450
MNDYSTVDFFTDPSVIDDPHPYFHHLRSRCPVLREPFHGAFMVTGYDEAMELYGGQRNAFSSCVAVTGPIPPLPFEPEGDDVSRQIEAHRHDMPFGNQLVAFDGPEHLAQRTLLTQLLTAARLQKNAQYMQGLADRLIDRIIDRGRCEVVSEYAHAMSTLVICDLLGVPDEDRDELVELLGLPPTQLGGDAEIKTSPDPNAHLNDRFSRYLEERRSRPCGDAMSDLANSRFKDGSVPDLSVLVRLATFLFAAGQDTSARLIASAFQILGECPHLQHRLRAEPHRIPNFVEETLRIDSPVKVLSRLARSSTSIGGVAVPAGSVVTIALGAVNHDPRHFENPDQFDFDRPHLRDHIAFSRGAHACPGAPLARLECCITLERFFNRLKDIRISEAEHGPPDARRYRYEPTYLLRGLSKLHIEFQRV